MSRVCRGPHCGRAILFARTPTGKVLVLDPQPVPVASAGDLLFAVGEDGLCRRVREGYGYRPHWVTCPDAEQFHRRRREPPVRAEGQ